MVVLVVEGDDDVDDDMAVVVVPWTTVWEAETMTNRIFLRPLYRVIRPLEIGSRMVVVA